MHDGMTWTWPVVGAILTSSLLHLGYSLCLQRGYQVADLSVVYPIARGTGPLLSTTGAFLLLGEPATSTGIIGMLCVVGGVLLIATQGRLAISSRPRLGGVRWGVVIGLFIAAYTVVDAYGVKVLLISPVLFDWFTCVTRTTMMPPTCCAAAPRPGRPCADTGIWRWPWACCRRWATSWCCMRCATARR